MHPLEYNTLILKIETNSRYIKLVLYGWHHIHVSSFVLKHRKQNDIKGLHPWIGAMMYMYMYSGVCYVCEK